MNGDSNLVLEALIVSPAVTHSIFVLLNAGSEEKKRYAVSLWETKKTLNKLLYPLLDLHYMMSVGADLVPLLTMNGNDYLPKL